MKAIKLNENYWNNSKNNKNLAELAWFLTMGKATTIPVISQDDALAEWHRAYAKRFTDILNILIESTLVKRGNTEPLISNFSRKSIYKAFRNSGKNWSLLDSNARIWLEGGRTERPKLPSQKVAPFNRALEWRSFLENKDIKESDLQGIDRQRVIAEFERTIVAPRKRAENRTDIRQAALGASKKLRHLILDDVQLAKVLRNRKWKSPALDQKLESKFYIENWILLRPFLTDNQKKNKKLIKKSVGEIEKQISKNHQNYAYLLTPDKKTPSRRAIGRKLRKARIFALGN